jgi:protein TonB
MKPAEPIQKVAPVYPRAARTLRISGRVEVEADIDESGSVSGAKAVSGPAPLRSAAHDAVLKWTFKPATRNGVPVRSKIKISVIFNP